MRKVLVSVCAIIMLLCGGVVLSACGKETERVDVGIVVINESTNTLNQVTISGTYKGDKFTEIYKTNSNKQVDENTDVTLTAQPALGYSFAYWLVDDDIYSTSPTITYNEEHEDQFVAHFIKGNAQTMIVSGAYLKEIPLTVVNGTISFSLQGYTLTANGTGTFAGWTLNNTPYTVSTETFELPYAALQAQNKALVFVALYNA